MKNTILLFLLICLAGLVQANCGSLANGQYYLVKALAPTDPKANYTVFQKDAAYVDEAFIYSIQGIANRQSPCLYVEMNNAWPEGKDYTFTWERVLANDPDIRTIAGTNFQPVIALPENIFAAAKDLGVANYFFWNIETGVSTNNWDWIDIRSSPARMAASSYAGAKGAIAIPFVKRGQLNNLSINIKNPSTMQNFQTIEELKAYLDSLGFSQTQSEWNAFENEIANYSTTHGEYEVKLHAYNWLVQNWLNNSSFGLSKDYFCALGIGADDQCIEKRAFAFFLSYWPNQSCNSESTPYASQCRIAYALSNSTNFYDKEKDHAMAEYILSQSSSNATVFGWSNSEPWFAFTNSKFGHVTAQTGGRNFSFISKIPVNPQYMTAPQPRTDYQYDESKYYSGIMISDSSYANGAGTMFYDSFTVNASGVGSFTTQTKLNWGIDSAFYDRAPILLAYYSKKARPGVDFLEAGTSGDYFYALAVAKFKGMQSLDAILEKNRARIQNSGLGFFANPWDGFTEGAADNSTPNFYGLEQSYYQTNCIFSQQTYARYYQVLGVKNAFQAADSTNCITNPRSPVYTIGNGPSKTTIISRTTNPDFFGFSPNTTAEFDSKFTTFKNNYNIKTPLIWFTDLRSTASTVPKMNSTKLRQIELSHPELKFVLLDELYYMASLLYNNGLQNPAFVDSATPIWKFSSADASIAASDFAASSGKSLKLNNYSFAFQKPPALTSSSGKKFKLTYWAKKTNANCTPFVAIQELPSWSAKATQYLDSTSWKQYSLIFTLQSNNEHIVTLATANQDTGKGACALFDDVRLAETNETGIQENCSNGTDDDGDSLIDCIDFTDCPNSIVCGTGKKCGIQKNCITVPTSACPDAKPDRTINIQDLVRIVKAINENDKAYDITGDNAIDIQDLRAAADKIGTNC